MRVHHPQRRTPGYRDAIGVSGAILGAIDLVRVEDGSQIRDLTVACVELDHAGRVVTAVRRLPDIVVHTSRTAPSCCTSGQVVRWPPTTTPNDITYRGCRAASAPSPTADKAWQLTIKGNSVAVVSDGSAVLGLGNIGPEAAMPVMEGKAMLFKEFAGIDAYPICLRTQDAEEIINTVANLSVGLRRHQPRRHLRAALF